jgi:hypothetical protein
VQFLHLNAVIQLFDARFFLKNVNWNSLSSLLAVADGIGIPGVELVDGLTSIFEIDCFENKKSAKDIHVPLSKA